MSEPVRMTAESYAKKLRARMAELRKEHEAHKKAYPADLLKWRLAMKAWIFANMAVRIDAQPVLSRYSSRNSDRDFDPISFFAGAPKPPKKPAGEILRKCQNALRRLAITGQSHILLRNDELDELFGLKEPE